MKICKLGIWDETIPGIKFDENGISNYAKIQLKLMEDFPRREQGKKQWEKIVEQVKKKGRNKKYDCVAGISGGTDSSYMLYLLKQYGLRPLAVNLDNGWNSEIAVANIEKVTRSLEIDLETYVIDYEEIKELFRCYMIACLPWIDSPSDMAIQAILYQIAHKEGVNDIFIGNDFRSEGKQPTEWTYSDYKQLKFIHKKYGRIPLKTYPTMSLIKFFYYGFFRNIKMIPIYNYLDYTKKEAQKFLIERFGWQYYGEHHHENLFTKFAIGYWQYKKFGIDKRKITYSSQVLSGEISRDEALNRVAKLPYNEEEIKKDLDYILNKLNFSHDEFQQIWNAPNKTFREYPSYYHYFEKFYRYLWPVLSHVLPVKPKIFYEYDERKKQGS
ncbi:N-acetyl sugar amidotransferase [Melioribacter roseus P3M-2]|uniref:N-acetyl sugar amidotransferase n=1 Tax=Melioribacter roseus (strain DSM 23840 / JCM 17771 / VKM B-2668 / P3M-2) TaxID=1191523 RepID=I7A402_MELRP|nr:N-acetyl sugar amidotransferase [Melioribacter roseus]AFN75908.1 N-acetyl sugar amidotransferase [Melioribacter roseus P3M-2]